MKIPNGTLASRNIVSDVVQGIIVVSAGRHYSGRQVQDVAGRRNAMISTMKHKHLITFASVMVVAWAVGTFLFRQIHAFGLADSTAFDSRLLKPSFAARFE